MYIGVRTDCMCCGEKVDTYRGVSTPSGPELKNAGAIDTRKCKEVRGQSGLCAPRSDLASHSSGWRLDGGFILWALALFGVVSGKDPGVLDPAPLRKHGRGRGAADGGRKLRLPSAASRQGAWQEALPGWGRDPTPEGRRIHGTPWSEEGVRGMESAKDGGVRGCRIVGVGSRISHGVPPDAGTRQVMHLRGT